MPNLREIKTHIQSVQRIAKVTRAMEMEAAAKNRRVRSRAESSRPFAVKSWEVLAHLASAAESYVRTNPMFCGRARVDRIGMLLFTSDRGMVGAYNHNVIAMASRYIESSQVPVELVTIGKMGRDAMLRRGYHIHAEFAQLADTIDIAAMSPVAGVLLDGFRDRIYDQAVVAHTQFRPRARMRPTVQQLLPLCPLEPAQPRPYIYEPGPEQLLQALLSRLVRFQIYQAFLESLAAETMSRMVAMHTATENASDLVDHLTITYNKARQQAITREISDIMGGATALGHG